MAKVLQSKSEASSLLLQQVSGLGCGSAFGVYGLVFKAHRLNSRLESNKEEEGFTDCEGPPVEAGFEQLVVGTALRRALAPRLAAPPPATHGHSLVTGRRAGETSLLPPSLLAPALQPPHLAQGLVSR